MSDSLFGVAIVSQVWLVVTVSFDETAVRDCLILWGVLMR